MPVPLPVGAPLNRSCAFRCLGFVSARLAPRLCGVVQLSVLARVLSCAFHVCISERATRRDKPFGVHGSYMQSVLLMRSWGRFPWWGGP